MDPGTHTVTFEGGFLRRGFWLYVWEVLGPAADEPVLYVGRTGDSSSLYAQSPFNRMGQHLGTAVNSSMLRQHLGRRSLDLEACRYRLVAHGPLLQEAQDDQVLHRERRDRMSASEKALASDLAAAGYDVLNIVRSHMALDEVFHEEVLAAFGAERSRSCASG